MEVDFLKIKKNLISLYGMYRVPMLNRLTRVYFRVSEKLLPPFYGKMHKTIKKPLIFKEKLKVREMREATIEKRLQAEVKKLGGTTYKFVSPGHNGVPDRIVLMPCGRVIFVELKTDSGVLSPIQTATIRKMRTLGAEVCVLHGRAGVDGFLDGLRMRL